MAGEAVEEGVETVEDEAGNAGGGGGGGEGGEFAARPVHDNQDGVDVGVDVGEKAGEFEAECLERVGEVVEGAHDQRRGRHVVGGPHALAEIPDGDAGFLQGRDLRVAVLRVEDQGLEGLGERGEFDEVGDRGWVCWGEDEAGDAEGEDEDEEGEEGVGFGRGHAVGFGADEIEEGNEGFAVLDFGADAEADV